MTTIDPDKLRKAREWAKPVHPGHHPEAVAAAEVMVNGLATVLHWPEVGE